MPRRSAFKMLFKIVTIFVLILPVVIGVYLLITPMSKLVKDNNPMKLPMPDEGTRSYFLLTCLYRFFGVMALGFAIIALCVCLSQ